MKPKLKIGDTLALCQWCADSRQITSIQKIVVLDLVDMLAVCSNGSWLWKSPYQANTVRTTFFGSTWFFELFQFPEIYSLHAEFWTTEHDKIQNPTIVEQ